jgi:uncharacterized membrane protein
VKHDPAGNGLDFLLSPSRALVGEPVELIDTHMTIKGTRPTVQEPASAGSAGGASRRFALGLVRAFGGAILFSFPMLMTMEMWWLGFYMDPLRLALFILLDIPLLVGLSYYAGFEPTSQHLADVMDAFTAYAVGFAAAGLLLVLFAIIGPGMSADEIIGKIAVQAVPASIGAMLARSQFGEHLWFVFLRFTIVGYATALLISVFILWTFGRTDGLTVGQIIQATVVLGFPAALGAGAARLILLSRPDSGNEPRWIGGSGVNGRGRTQRRDCDGRN